MLLGNFFFGAEMENKSCAQSLAMFFSFHC